MLTDRDRREIAKTEEWARQSRAEADRATDPTERRHFLRVAKQFDGSARTQRMFPFSIALFFAWVNASLLPWVFLNRAGSGLLGVVMSCTVALGLVLVKRRVDRRRDAAEPVVISSSEPRSERPNR